MATRATVFPNGVRTFARDARSEVKTGSYTAVLADSGKTIIMEATGTVTLPSAATSGGMVITVVNNADDGTLVQVSPNAIDNIPYANDATDDKDLINTAATALKGDYVVLLQSGTNWVISDIQGIWAKEA